MAKEKKLKMTAKTSLQEHAKLSMEQLSKQQPTNFEEAKAQFDRLKKQGEESFSLAAPMIQEEVKKMTTPLSSEDARRICRWLFRKQITIEMIPKDVLVDLQGTEIFEGTIRRIEEFEKRKATE
jgi:DUF917 family protein